jgi:hypothetical protein
MEFPLHCQYELYEHHNASLAYLHRRYIGPHVFPRVRFSGMLLLHEPFGIPGTRRLEKQSSAQLGKSAAAVPREGELTLAPRVQGITFNPPSRSFLWEESVHREEFRFRAGAVLEGSTEYQFMGCHDCVVEALAEIAREQVLLADCMREEARGVDDGGQAHPGDGADAGGDVPGGGVNGSA